MSNAIHLVGYISKVNKVFTNEDGSKRIIVSLACRTGDPKRYQDETYNRDFYNVSIDVPAQSKLPDYLVEGKDIAITGKPYFSHNEEHKQEYFNIRVSGPEYVTLLGGEKRQGAPAKSAEPAPERHAVKAPAAQW